MRAWRMLACLTLTLIAVMSPAQAQKSDNTLRIAWRDAIPDVDPYYNQLRTGLVLAHQAWDTLIYRDPDTFQIKPLLALSWKQTNDTTWEFELRPGVKFHDGSPFSADDVVYTINTVLADPHVAVPSNFSYLAGAEKIDDMHVRVKLKRIFPAALEYMSMTLPIWPKAYRERVGTDAYGKAPVGTGPYKITKVDGISEIDLERNDDYFDGPKGHPQIARLVIHEVADAADEITEILAGRADWIWAFNPDQFEDHQPCAHAAGGAGGKHADRLYPVRCGRPHRGGQSADQGCGAPGHRPCDRPGDDRPPIGAGRQPGVGRRVLPHPIRLRPGCRHEIRV